MTKNGFTLIELLVTIGVMMVIFLSVGSIMMSSFKVQKSTQTNETVSAKAVYVLGELKRNILDARLETIDCTPYPGANSISFQTKSGGSTALLCDEGIGQIASQSAHSTYDFLSEGVTASNCLTFVSCEFGTDGQVVLVSFNLGLGMTSGNTVLGPWNFQGVVTPRN